MANVTDPNVGGLDPLKANVPPPVVIPPIGKTLEDIDASVRSEIAEVERETVHSGAAPRDGSGLESAHALSRLARIVRDKAHELRNKAQEAFFKEATPVAESQPAQCAPIADGLNDYPLPSDVKEQLADIEHRIARLHVPGNIHDPATIADLLDNAAITLEQKARDIDERIRDVAAQELNDLDGFDR